MSGGEPWLARIAVYPLKSFDGLELEEARVRGGAGLEHDREYRLTDEGGAVLNGKRLGEALMRIRASFDLAFGEISLELEGERLTAKLPREAALVEAWLSERFGVKAKLERDAEKGFPDDEELSGPTLVSRATLAEVASWFEGMDEAEARRRFRANLEIDGVPAFWEDRLFTESGRGRPFQIGEATFEGMNPCARCAVPSRDSRNGAIREPRFAKIFAERRKASLPAWADASRFDHFYRLTVNTLTPLSENGKTLRRGDSVWLL